MKLQQGQQYKCQDKIVRIVRLQRLAVDYKELPLLPPDDGSDSPGIHRQATKKEFCRMIKGAELIPPGS